MKGLWRSDVMFLGALLGLGIAGAQAVFDGPTEPEVTAQHVAIATQKKADDVRPEDRMALRNPIQIEACDATMKNGYYEHAMSFPRCYVKSSARQ